MKVYTHAITIHECIEIYIFSIFSVASSFINSFSSERAVQQQFSALCNSECIYSLIKLQPNLEFSASLHYRKMLRC